MADKAESSSYSTQVMMHAHTIHLHLFTIQDQSFFCIEAESTEAGTSTEWIYDTYGIIIPDNSLPEYISPDGRTAFGYDLSGEMEPMRKWYVTRKTAE